MGTRGRSARRRLEVDREPADVTNQVDPHKTLSYEDTLPSIRICLWLDDLCFLYRSQAIPKALHGPEMGSEEYNATYTTRLWIFVVDVEGVWTD
jgi:hypothetical protein